MPNYCNITVGIKGPKEEVELFHDIIVEDYNYYFTPEAQAFLDHQGFGELSTEGLLQTPDLKDFMNNPYNYQRVPGKGHTFRMFEFTRPKETSLEDGLIQRTYDGQYVWKDQLPVSSVIDFANLAERLPHCIIELISLESDTGFTEYVSIKEGYVDYQDCDYTEYMLEGMTNEEIANMLPDHLRVYFDDCFRVPEYLYDTEAPWIDAKFLPEEAIPVFQYL